MERPVLQGCQGCCTFKKGTIITPEPGSWLSLADACQDVVKCLNSNGGTGKRLVVHFFLPGTQIRVDIGNGKIKAAGFLCVLGISVGIGTYVLYKIYDRFFRPGSKRRPSASSDGEEEEEEEEDVCCVLGKEEKADKGIMGNQQSSLADIPVYYKPGYGVSLYTPAVDEPTLLRNRKHGNSLHGDNILKGNLVSKNGVSSPPVSVYCDSSQQDLSDGKRKSPKFGELRIEIDESGFVEDEGFDQNNGNRLSNSLKGNFSPTSLYEKNCLLSPVKSPNCGDGDGNYDAVCDLANQGCAVSECNGDNHGDCNGSRDKSPELSRLNLVTTLGASSVLLTPPSEDESSSSSQQFYSGSAQFSQHSTKSDVSDIRSEIADHLISDQQMIETDEEQEQMSPLPFDRSPHRTPERQFKKKLLIKLHEVSRGSTTQSSNNSSSCSTPDNLSNGRQTDSGSAEVANSISGVSSPELELLNSEGSSECQREITFENLEDEIHVVEDEFETISQKIHELVDKYAKQTEEPGIEILNNIFQRYPSIRLRQQERGIIHHQLPSLSESDSQDVANTSQCSDDVDLSWDLENVLDMVYSEASDSSSMHSNPLFEKAGELERKLDTHDSGLSVIMEVGSGQYSGSFNSNIDLEGSMYEDDFHVQLSGSKSNQCLEVDGECMVLSAESGLEPSTTSDTGSSTTCNNGSSTICNIGPSLDIVEYADTEWKGDTPKASTIRKAYREIPQYCRCCHLRQIRGDNYCGVRGAVFQFLVNRLPLNPIWSSSDEVLQNLQRAYNDPSSGIRLWSFARRISYTSDTQMDVMSHCIGTFFEKMSEMMDHNSYAERLEFVSRLLNSDLDTDLYLLEGVKLLMFLSALHLHGDMQQGNDVPVFAWLMFARDTSEDLPSLVEKHLNPVGNAGGLEQVEMFLLGYALGVRIQVFRLQQFGEEDFIAYYPDDCAPDWPTLYLIAEDDRHYNVPVQ